MGLPVAAGASEAGERGAELSDVGVGPVGGKRRGYGIGGEKPDVDAVGGPGGGVDAAALGVELGAGGGEVFGYVVCVSGAVGCGGRGRSGAEG